MAQALGKHIHLRYLFEIPLGVISKSAGALAGAALEGLETFLERDAEGVCQAKSLSLSWASEHGEEISLQVPLLALSKASKLGLAAGHVSGAVELVGTRSQRGTQRRVLEGAPAPSKVQRERSNRRRGRGVVDFDLQVRRADMPEGWQRIEERLSPFITLAAPEAVPGIYLPVTRRRKTKAA